MRRGFDLMDFWWERDFGDGGVGVAEAVGPAFGEDAADVGFEDGLDDGLSEGGGVGDDDGAEADVDDLLAVGTRLGDEGGEFRGRRPGGGFVEEPVACDADPVAVVEGGHDDAGAEVVEEGDFVGLHLVEVGAAQVELLLAPAVHLPGDGFPEDVVEHDVRDVVVRAAHFVFGDGEGMRVRARAGPGHGESAEVGHSKSLRDVDACHGAWAFDEEVGILAGVPGGGEKLVDPAAKFDGGFSEEGVCEHAVLDTDSHELGGVAFDGCEVYAMFSDPWLELSMGGDLRSVAFGEKAFA